LGCNATRLQADSFSWLLAWLDFSTLKMEAICSFETSAQETVHFILTSVKSHPTQYGLQSWHIFPSSGTQQGFLFNFRKPDFTAKVLGIGATSLPFLWMELI
jgi:hypothetical protein